MNGLAVAPRALMWSRHDEPQSRQIEQEFEALLHEALLAHVRACGEEEWVRTQAAALPAETFRRFLRAPRTGQRLLWPEQAERAETMAFLRAALRAESVLAGLEPPGGFAAWTADCRAFVDPEGVFRQKKVGGVLPLDLVSPFARSLDLTGGSAAVLPPRPIPAPATQRAVAGRIGEALEGIGVVSPDALDRVLAWTRVVVAQNDGTGRFSSGSNGQFVGRTMLVNVEVPSVPLEAIVDGLVHESIHGLLYMHETVNPWVTTFDLYTDEGAIVSPWSGTRLPVRPFMQACFVWYGLAMFWAGSMPAGIFDPVEASGMLTRALAGFARGPLVDELRAWRDHIDPALPEVIDELQSVVLSLLG